MTVFSLKSSTVFSFNNCALHLSRRLNHEMIDNLRMHNLRNIGCDVFLWAAARVIRKSWTCWVKRLRTQSKFDLVDEHAWIRYSWGPTWDKKKCMCFTRTNISHAPKATSDIDWFTTDCWRSVLEEICLDGLTQHNRIHGIYFSIECCYSYENEFAQLSVPTMTHSWAICARYMHNWFTPIADRNTHTHKHARKRLYHSTPPFLIRSCDETCWRRQSPSSFALLAVANLCRCNWFFDLLPTHERSAYDTHFK